VALPTYPFERQRYWVEPTEVARREGGGEHKEVLFESLIGPRALPYLADHRIYGSVVLPATAYLEMGLAAGEETLGPGVHVLEDVVISEAMVLRRLKTGWCR